MSIGAGTALTAGSATITATNGGQTATLAITVVDGTLITPSPTTLSLAAGGTTSQFTVVCRKPDGTTDATPTYTATSSNTAYATVTQSGTTVTVTPVAAGSCTINLSYTSTVSTATGSVGITVTGTPGTVTSVTPIYNGASVTNGALLFTGSSYSFSAKDQSGNVLDGTVGTWSTSDGTNAPINATTGVCTPSASAAGATLTYTHTASGHTGTIPVTVLKGGYTVVHGDRAANYANDAAFRNNINSAVTTGYSTPTPTGGVGALYQDGRDTGYMTLDSTRLFMGQQTFLRSYPGSLGSSAILRADLPANTTRVWWWRHERYALAGESGPWGTAVNYTPYTAGATGNAADKAGPGGGMVGGGHNGRIDFGYNNGNASTWNNDWYIPDNQGNYVEISGPSQGQGDADGREYVRIGLMERRGPNVWSCRQWLAPMGSAPTLVGNVQADMATTTTAWVIATSSPFGENYNQGRAAGANMYRTTAGWDASTDGDPFGLLGSQPTPTVSSASSGTALTAGDSNKTLTITGTGFNANCGVSFSNAGITVTAVSNNNTNPNGDGGNVKVVSPTSITVQLDVSVSATGLPGTVTVTNYASGATASVTITP